jgi:hypothetical protein
MQKFNMPSLVVFFLLMLSFLHTVPANNNCSTGTRHTGNHKDNNMSDAWIPIRRRRGRCPFTNGGRGLPRGGRNAMNPAAAPATPREGSPITTRLKTTSYINSTTDDTLALFLQVTPIFTHHVITVSPEHVIKLLWRPHTPNLYPLLNQYPHISHSCLSLRGTMALIKLNRGAYADPNRAYRSNYQLLNITYRPLHKNTRHTLPNYTFQ